MEQQTVYACIGDCGGVSAVARNCGAAQCVRYNQPLEARIQCLACATQSQQDGKPHACAQCQKA